MLSNLLLQRILDEAADDEKKKKADKEGDQEKAEDTEEQETEQTEEEETPDDNPDDNSDNEDNPGEPEENPEESEGETPEGTEPAPEDGETPAEGEEAGEGGVGEGEGEEGGLGDFSMDGDDPEEDLGPAPDGLPEPDDDGSSDMEEEEDPEGETNIQTNILKLSKLDRALAKKAVGEDLVSLRSTINAALGVIDRNESAIDPDVRDLSVEKLNNLLGELESFILHKFPILNYEDSLTQYLVFAKKVNDSVEYVKTDGIKGGKK